MSNGNGTGTGGNGSGSGNALYGSVSTSGLGSAALFSVDGVLANCRVSPYVDTRTGEKRYIHNLTIYQAATRKYWRCTMWDDRVIDLRPCLGRPLSFNVTGLRPAREERYGTVLGQGIPAVECSGSVPVDVMEHYRSEIELEV